LRYKTSKKSIKLPLMGNYTFKMDRLPKIMEGKNNVDFPILDKKISCTENILRKFIGKK